MKKKYMLNINTGTLHIIDACYLSKVGTPSNVKFFDTEDEAVNYSGRYMKNCKLCFRKRDRTNM